MMFGHPTGKLLLHFSTMQWIRFTKYGPVYNFTSEPYCENFDMLHLSICPLISENEPYSISCLLSFSLAFISVMYVLLCCIIPSIAVVCISGGKFFMICSFIYWKISLVRMRCCKGGVLDSLERKLYFFDLYFANISFLLVSYDPDMWG